MMISHDRPTVNERYASTNHSGEGEEHTVNHLKEGEGVKGRDEFYSAMYSHMRVEEVMFKANSDRMAAIENDLRPLRSMYWAVVGSGGIATLLLATLVYIYVGDQADSKSMQQTLHIQGTAIETLLEKYHFSEKDIDKLDSRVRVLEGRGVRAQP